MSGETNLVQILKNMRPVLNEGEYVFCIVKDLAEMKLGDVLMLFREEEGCSLILNRI
jgi:uncharacterized protein